VSSPPRLALDLGCGPGLTSRLVAEVTRAALVVGLDTSEPFLGAARTSSGPPHISFVRHDVATSDFPTLPPDLVYARLLLAHLADPGAVASRWAAQLAPGGALLLDEVEFIHTDNPVLAFYEEVVVGLVGTRGAPMYAGPLVADLTGDGWARRSTTLRRLGVATADAARMYALNLTTWRDDPFVVDTYDRAAVDELAAGLDNLSRSAATDEITWGLRQVAYERERA
jgi:trans-aconitate 2-methyltransferase